MRVRYRFVGRDGDRYVWQSEQRLCGDSRVRQITCSVAWFWARGTGDADAKTPSI